MAGTASVTPLLMSRTRSEQQTTRPILPRDYAHLVDFHSKRSAAETVYPGYNFGNLANHLLQPYERQSTAHTHDAVPATDSASHASFVSLYSFGLHNNTEAVHFTLPTQLNALDLDTGAGTHGHLLFIRGNIAPEWLNVIGGKFRLDPEFFQRHLDFKRVVPRPDSFQLPTLPSAANHMTRFRLSTLGFVDRHRNNHGWFDQADLNRTRKRAEDSWTSYLQRLSRGRITEDTSGDSIVRDFSIHDHDHFSLEQDISVNITSVGDKWLAIVWLDVGRDLHLNPKDPWNLQLFKVDSLMISFPPTIQQRRNVALQGKSYISKASTSEGDPNNTRITQTASLLHLEYASRLEMDAARNGPLCVLLDILRLCASSELQLLNMIETKINMELSPAQSEAQNEPTVSNLLYHKRVLRRHMQRLLENKRFIEYQTSLQTMEGIQSPPLNHSKANVNAICQDFDHLYEKARDLTSDCDRGMSIMMNKASIKEAQKGIVQAETVTQLTKLAFTFVPLNFTCSFFGMNFSQFSNGNHLELWVWFAISLPILALSIVFMKWDMSQAIRRSLGWRSGRNGHNADSKISETSTGIDIELYAYPKRDVQV